MGCSASVQAGSAANPEPLPGLDNKSSGATAAPTSNNKPSKPAPAEESTPADAVKTAPDTTATDNKAGPKPIGVHQSESATKPPTQPAEHADHSTATHLPTPAPEPAHKPEAHAESKVGPKPIGVQLPAGATPQPTHTTVDTTTATHLPAPNQITKPGMPATREFNPTEPEAAHAQHGHGAATLNEPAAGEVEKAVAAVEGKSEEDLDAQIAAAGAEIAAADVHEPEAKAEPTAAVGVPAVEQDDDLALEAPPEHAAGVTADLDDASEAGAAVDEQLAAAEAEMDKAEAAQAAKADEE